MMTLQGPIKAFLDEPLAGSGNRIDTGLQGGGDLAVAPCFAGVRGVGFEQDACFQEHARGVFALSDRRVQLLPFLIAELHDVFLDRDLFPGHEATPLLVAEPSSQRLTAESRTRGTRTDSDDSRGRAIGW